MNVPDESPRILSVQVGHTRQLGAAESSDPMLRAWNSAIFKEAVEGPVWVSTSRVSGDEQADLRVHGGPDKAVFAYPVEHLRTWAVELGLTKMAGGGFGENLTTAGLLEDSVCIGDTLRAGGVLLQVSQPRGPCWKLARRWNQPDLALRVDESGRTGWYYRVLQEGYLQAGDPLQLVERPNPQWTVLHAYFILRAPALFPTKSLELAGLAHLSAASRASLLRGLQQNRRAPHHSTLTGEDEDD
jgi:MOSC domain-containing protein YiiM